MIELKFSEKNPSALPFSLDDISSLSSIKLELFSAYSLDVLLLFLSLIFPSSYLAFFGVIIFSLVNLIDYTISVGHCAIKWDELF